MQPQALLQQLEELPSYLAWIAMWLLFALEAKIDKKGQLFFSCSFCVKLLNNP